MPLKDQSEKGKKYIRTTISINLLNYKTISSLVGIKGKSISSIINTIINEWVELNSNQISEIWNVDLISLRKLAQMEYEEINIEKDIKKFELKLIKKISKSFKMIKRVKIEDLAKGLEVSNEIVNKIIISYGEELSQTGMSFYIENGYLINKELS